MKRILLAAALAAAAFAAQAQVSVSIGQPGFYGRLDIGGFPAPPVLYPRPILIERVPAPRPPIYLRVPPGHAKHWKHHCHAYHACGERVYFVQDGWYQREYVPRYTERHHHDYDRRDYYRDERRRDDYRRDDRRRDDDYDRGPGRDHGHGHGPRH